MEAGIINILWPAFAEMEGVIPWGVDDLYYEVCIGICISMRCVMYATIAVCCTV